MKEKETAEGANLHHGSYWTNNTTHACLDTQPDTFRLLVNGI